MSWSLWRPELKSYRPRVRKEYLFPSMRRAFPKPSFHTPQSSWMNGVHSLSSDVHPSHLSKVAFPCDPTGTSSSEQEQHEDTQTCLSSQCSIPQSKERTHPITPNISLHLVAQSSSVCCVPPLCQSGWHLTCPGPFCKLFSCFSSMWTGSRSSALG